MGEVAALGDGEAAGLLADALGCGLGLEIATGGVLPHADTRPIIAATSINLFMSPMCTGRA